SAGPGRSAMAVDMQRWAATTSGAKPKYSPASASTATNSTLRSPAAADAWRAAASALSSRSMPMTRSQRGASASARRPRPVPTSSTVRPASRSSASSFRKAGLMPPAVSGAIGFQSSGDGALGRARYEPRVLGHHAPGIARLRLLHGLEALLELGARKLHVEAPLFDVDHDRVAGSQRGDRPTVGGLGRDVADHEAVRGAGEPAIGHERDLVDRKSVRVGKECRCRWAPDHEKKNHA